LGLGVNDLLLPLVETNGALMLAPRPVLREQARELAGVDADVHAVLVHTTLDQDLVVRKDALHGSAHAATISGYRLSSAIRRRRTRLERVIVPSP